MSPRPEIEIPGHWVNSNHYTTTLMPSCAHDAQVQALRNEEGNQRAIVADTRATTPKAMYNRDLDAFVAALEDYEQREREALAGVQRTTNRAGAAKKVFLDGCLKSAASWLRNPEPLELIRRYLSSLLLFCSDCRGSHSSFDAGRAQSTSVEDFAQ